MKLESKIGKIGSNNERIYSFLSDFNNFQNLIPQDKVKNWESTIDECKFTLDGLGETGMKIIEKEPHKLIKITGIEGSKFDFLFWIQLKQLQVNETAVKLTMQVELNAMYAMMAKKPLQQFLDTLVDQMKNLKFE